MLVAWCQGSVAISKLSSDGSDMVIGSIGEDSELPFFGDSTLMVRLPYEGRCRIWLAAV